MSEERRMRIVRSLAGRDKGRLFLVVGVTDKGGCCLQTERCVRLKRPRRRKRSTRSLLKGEPF